MGRVKRGSIVYGDIVAERRRASEKHAGPEDREVVSWRDPLWLPILAEEFGEVAHELTSGSGETVRVALRDELVQLAAMACAWVDAIDESLALERVNG